MKNTDYTTTMLVDQTPDEVFNAINDVTAWWSEDFKGKSKKLNDEFEVHFADVHHSHHKITELIPGKKVTWLVTDSKLNFLKDKTEWNGTSNIFEISPSGSKTELKFTHQGLNPNIECFKDCSNGWNYYMQSLQNFITTGIGQPNIKS